MPRDLHDRKLTRRHRFRDVSHIRLIEIIKSLRHRKLRKNISTRSSLIQSQSFPPPFPDNARSPVQPPTLDPPPPPALRLSHYRSDTASILSITEEDCSFATSASSPSPHGVPFDVYRRLNYSSAHSVPSFPTSPSMFDLRSAATEDYLVGCLEQNLRHLHLGDLTSPDHVSLFRCSPRDLPMDISPQSIINHGIPFRRASSEKNVREPTSSPPDQNVIPMILITSAGAEHAKPLPLSDYRPSCRRPFGLANTINKPTNASAESKQKTSLRDDPFTTHPVPHGAAYPPANNPTFHLPPFPSMVSSSPYAPETPTPMFCDHLGDCRGELWEILHPPLVANRFTLPPFELPPLNAGLFDGISW